jgi:hypothetical protein
MMYHPVGAGEWTVGKGGGRGRTEDIHESIFTQSFPFNLRINR